MVGANILVTENEDDLIEIQKQVWIKILKENVSSENPGRLGYDFHSNLEGLPDELIAQMRYCGSIKGATVTDNGSTVQFSNIMKAFNIEKWYIFKPDDRYLTGLSGYAIQTLLAEWLPPEGEI